MDTLREGQHSSEMRERCLEEVEAEKREEQPTTERSAVLFMRAYVQKDAPVLSGRVASDLALPSICTGVLDARGAQPSKGVTN